MVSRVSRGHEGAKFSVFFTRHLNFVSSDSFSYSWAWALGVLALAALLLFLHLGERALWGPEGRWAEITREMQLSGNYFWPTINGAVYYDKPLLSYWLIAGAARLMGGIHEASARLPSAIAGLLGVALVIALSRRLYGFRTAMLAGFILATSYDYVFFSRLASADLETATGILAALTVFVFHGEEDRGRWRVLFWLIMAVTSLTKGLMGFALPLLVVGVYSLLAEGWRGLLEGISAGTGQERPRRLYARCRWFFHWKTLAGLGLAAVIYFLPFAISQARMHSPMGIAMVFHENIVRFLAPFDHREPVYLYLYAVFTLMAPWSAYLPAALLQMHSRCCSRSDRFTLVYFWVTFVFFTVSGSRRSYYLLPLLPAAAIMVARVFSLPGEELGRRAQKLLQGGFILAVCLLVAGGVLALLPPTLRPRNWSELPGLPDRAASGVFWVLMLAAVVFAFFTRLQRKSILLSTAAVAYTGLLFMFAFLLPATERYRGEKAFAQTVKAELKGDFAHLVLYKVWAPGLLFYLASEKPLFQLGEGLALEQWLESHPGYWVILPERDLSPLSLHGSVVAREYSLRWGPSPYWRSDHLLIRPDPLPH